MIDPTTVFGKTLLVFFWGGLAANIVSFLWVTVRFDPIYLPWLVVIINMLLVSLKNKVLPIK